MSKKDIYSFIPAHKLQDGDELATTKTYINKFMIVINWLLNESIDAKKVTVDADTDWNDLNDLSVYHFTSLDGPNAPDELELGDKTGIVICTSAGLGDKFQIAMTGHGAAFRSLHSNWFYVGQGIPANVDVNKLIDRETLDKILGNYYTKPQVDNIVNGIYNEIHIDEKKYATKDLLHAELHKVYDYINKYIITDVHDYETTKGELDGPVYTNSLASYNASDISYTSSSASSSISTLSSTELSDTTVTYSDENALPVQIYNDNTETMSCKASGDDEGFAAPYDDPSNFDVLSLDFSFEGGQDEGERAFRVTSGKQYTLIVDDVTDDGGLIAFTNHWKNTGNNGWNGSQEDFTPEPGPSPIIDTPVGEYVSEDINNPRESSYNDTPRKNTLVRYDSITGNSKNSKGVWTTNPVTGKLVINFTALQSGVLYLLGGYSDYATFNGIRVIEEAKGVSHSIRVNSGLASEIAQEQNDTNIVTTEESKNKTNVLFKDTSPNGLVTGYAVLNDTNLSGKPFYPAYTFTGDNTNPKYTYVITTRVDDEGHGGSQATSALILIDEYARNYILSHNGTLDGIESGHIADPTQKGDNSLVTFNQKGCYPNIQHWNEATNIKMTFTPKNYGQTLYVIPRYGYAKEFRDFTVKVNHPIVQHKLLPVKSVVASNSNNIISLSDSASNSINTLSNSTSSAVEENGVYDSYNLSSSSYTVSANYNDKISQSESELGILTKNSKNQMGWSYKGEQENYANSLANLNYNNIKALNSYTFDATHSNLSTITVTENHYSDTDFGFQNGHRAYPDPYGGGNTMWGTTVYGTLKGSASDAKDAKSSNADMLSEPATVFEIDNNIKDTKVSVGNGSYTDSYYTGDGTSTGYTSAFVETNLSPSSVSVYAIPNSYQISNETKFSVGPNSLSSSMSDAEHNILASDLSYAASLISAGSATSYQYSSATSVVFDSGGNPTSVVINKELMNANSVSNGFVYYTSDYPENYDVNKNGFQGGMFIYSTPQSVQTTSSSAVSGAKECGESAGDLQQNPIYLVAAKNNEFTKVHYHDTGTGDSVNKPLQFGTPIKKYITQNSNDIVSLEEAEPNASAGFQTFNSQSSYSLTTVKSSFEPNSYSIQSNPVSSNTGSIYANASNASFAISAESMMNSSLSVSASKSIGDNTSSIISLYYSSNSNVSHSLAPFSLFSSNSILSKKSVNSQTGPIFQNIADISDLTNGYNSLLASNGTPMSKLDSFGDDIISSGFVDSSSANLNTGAIYQDSENIDTLASEHNINYSSIISLFSSTSSNSVNIASENGSASESSVNMPVGGNSYTSTLSTVYIPNSISNYYVQSNTINSTSTPDNWGSIYQNTTNISILADAHNSNSAELLSQITSGATTMPTIKGIRNRNNHYYRTRASLYEYSSSANVASQSDPTGDVGSVYENTTNINTLASLHNSNSTNISSVSFSASSNVQSLMYSGDMPEDMFSLSSNGDYVQPQDSLIDSLNTNSLGPVYQNNENISILAQMHNNNSSSISMNSFSASANSSNLDTFMYGMGGDYEAVSMDSSDIYHYSSGASGMPSNAKLNINSMSGVSNVASLAYSNTVSLNNYYFNETHIVDARKVSSTSAFDFGSQNAETVVNGSFTHAIPTTADSVVSNDEHLIRIGDEIQSENANGNALYETGDIDTNNYIVHQPNYTFKGSYYIDLNQIEKMWTVLDPVCTHSDFNEPSTAASNFEQAAKNISNNASNVHRVTTKSKRTAYANYQKITDYSSVPQFVQNYHNETGDNMGILNQYYCTINYDSGNSQTASVIIPIYIKLHRGVHNFYLYSSGVSESYPPSAHGTPLINLVRILRNHVQILESEVSTLQSQ